MPRDYRLYVDDILEAVKRIRGYTRDMDYSIFDQGQEDELSRINDY
jgi:uncharacterized protein with HEPN domain